ncbi:ATP-binding cassette domain-containing protein [Nocardioides sp. CFH 31398]|uniref:ATP-binding cassette domain-containing protein n=1 Tax=Nocardioides sp. CFH 31398 TaxID=2919579 RepID=UPI001F056F61|nr:ATP-binding cassette domain-containing protein [Nocardioides sp. CFH 31398]MCH1867526.1 ATP-binding cassette domain-containing protein [Nocardioides sp. CFH 31398]
MVGALVVLLLLAAAVGGFVLTSDGDGVEVTETEGTVQGRPEPGRGPTALDVSVFTPAADAPGADAEGRRAAVMLAHGFGGSKDDLVDQARAVAAEGYVVLTWTARGFGDSGGLIHLSAPGWEIADVSALVDALAERDDVRLDGDGDPVVGIAGASYGGGAALMGAAYDDRVDAVVPAVTWNDLGTALFGQNADGPGAVPAGVFKERWAALLFGAGQPLGSAADVGGSLPGAPSGAPSEALPGGVCGRFAPAICRLYQQVAQTGRPAEGTLATLRRSSPAPVLDRVRAPTLLLQGESDSLFGLDQADATARALTEAGTDVAVRWVDGGHDAVPVIDEDDLVDGALGWFDHHLRGGPDPGTAFDLVLPAPALGEGEPERLTAPSYEDVTDPATTELTLDGPVQPVISPPGGEPSALTTLPGTGGALDALGGLGQSFRLAALPGATAVFDTAPVGETLTVVGAPSVRMEVTSTAQDATLFASLWVVAEDDSAVLPRQLVSPLRVEVPAPGETRTVTVRLPTSAYRVEPGQRLRLVVASTDAAYAVPGDARAYSVGLTDSALTLPVPETEAGGSSGPLVPTPLLAGVAALLGLAVLGAVVGAVRGGRRRRAGPPGTDDVPLVVDGLVKEYSNGFRAVDGVSWRAERGQVVGLLGPNGAGKTTTIRMLVGLISADDGSVTVLGRRVEAGSAVLGRVGALIEGPGFLPHLTGRQNLRAYWAATGRPADEAGFDDALAVADLGAAADKPVRSYSQGMRQRLGIAQAMLGSPDLLLLDEPTNGLDPPQIRAMRDVLTSYAASGRTVVVSSHLLGEVEQTCTHVVVMHRGRVVLTGAVDELTDDTGTTVVALADGQDVEGAAALLGATAGVTAARPTEDGRLRVEGTPTRDVVVATLVRAGYGVVGVDGRRHLEEVFMGLVGEDRPAQLEEAPR